ncbi:MAG TPA: ammonium transporter [Candidatus Deferrimicrobiaceae bacterium]
MKRPSRKTASIFLCLAAMVLLCGARFPAFAEEHGPDPTGAGSGTIADTLGAAANAPTDNEVKAMAKGEPLAVKLADVIGHNKISINMVWTLICGFLVMFMQVGFAMVETGFTRAKNASHTMAMNLVVYIVGILAYWLVGYAIHMGGCGGNAGLGGGGVLNGEFAIKLLGKEFGLFGTKGFGLGESVYDVTVFTLFFFNMVFMDTAATIPTGAMAERWKFSAFVVYGFFMAGLIYPLYANWVWGGGWLSQLGKNFALGHGHVDFAGSSVVHMTGGVCALVGAKILGPRIGKFNRNGSPNPIPGHHIPMAVVGTLILAFGWFGFNPGSTLAGTDLRIAVVVVNTMLASAAGGFSAMLYMWFRFGKPDISMTCNGLLAGLVAITAPCAFVTAPAAVLIGLLAGILCCVTVFFVERRLKVDDPVGAVAVHGANGAWGVLSLGLFADGKYGDGFNGVPGTVKGLFYGDASQFLAQVIGMATNLLFVAGAAYILFKLIDRVIGLRVSEEVELEGLDQHEVGAAAYADFNTRSTPFRASSGSFGREG